MLKNAYFEMLTFLAFVVAMPGFVFLYLSEAIEESAYKMQGKVIPRE
jgi:hypothetical protein